MKATSFFYLSALLAVIVIHETLAFSTSFRRFPVNQRYRSISQAAKKGYSDEGESLEEQFAEWEREEIEEQRRDLEDKVQKARESGTEDELPDYMLRLLAEYKDEATVEVDPVSPRMLPIIAVIGRPNTGKSTLVNRLSNSFKDGAIVHDEPGITRDRTYRTGMWNDYNFQVVDTGG
jgi:tRNA U34 5-carboxymethylaminomethyl modifying GTPase MnmE/TrmE